MKIVTKHVDVLEGRVMPDDFVNKYLVYLQDESGNNLACDEAYGEIEREATEDSFKYVEGNMNIPVEFIPLENGTDGE